MQHQTAFDNKRTYTYHRPARLLQKSELVQYTPPPELRNIDTEKTKKMTYT